MTNEKPTLVLVHGTNSNSYGWSGLVSELTLRGHRAVAVDLPGHGNSQFIPESYQAPQDLDALAVEPSPLAKFTVDDYVEHVTGVVRRARRLGPVPVAGLECPGDGALALRPVIHLPDPEPKHGDLSSVGQLPSISAHAPQPTTCWRAG
ncbi:alpha/beta hydrolase [Kribbella speibonae]|uniref:Alpha/beta fold hydrolase n=1 Tax=Kribbella speibonae TaxID=1572660 RepID=A0A4R0INT6_9ACTN|nr:alpha/beta fold hydrolase [Kribbella speibonae]TCC34110.1 alpha/beta fold hydrolase [Kribbella speibonae]